MGMKTSAGEIIQVQGGHIVRSTGRKDRHSKVFTAKGPRDRRVRLAAHTAIQFYDVQDRLGYDRPSKAVDWLLKKAKSAIDKLAELPPWHPTGNPNTNTNTNSTAATDQDPNGNSGENGVGEQSESSEYNFQLLRHLASFIPQHLDSDSMKSFFPTSSANTSLNFQSYPHDQTQDLCLSLQSFQDPELIRNPNHSNSMQFDANFQRMVTWNGDPDTENRGFLFNSQPPMLGQSPAFTQRGPLQSSFAPTVRACDEIPIGAAAAEHHKSQAKHQNSIFGSRFVSDGLPRFSIPARIHGEEQHNVVSDKPYSASSSSQH